MPAVSKSLDGGQGWRHVRYRQPEKIGYGVLIMASPVDHKSSRQEAARRFSYFMPWHKHEAYFQGYPNPSIRLCRSPCFPFCRVCIRKNHAPGFGATSMIHPFQQKSKSTFNLCLSVLTYWGDQSGVEADCCKGNMRRDWNGSL